MIGKKSRVLILIYIIFLVVLFLMCSTDLIIREPEKEIYQIAVIIEDVRDDNYGNFRKGMDRAAVECNADVRFITLYERLNEEQQLELLLREQEDGASALIVVPVDEERIGEALSSKEVTIPTVFLGTRAGEEKAAGEVIIDYEGMGRQLAEEMQRQIPGNSPIWLLLDPGDKSAMSQSFLEGATQVLGDSGHKCLQAESQGKDGYKKMLGNMTEEPAVILAGSPQTLTEVAGALSEEPELAGRVWGLYGRGSSMEILNGLDRGQITGICVTDEFSRGYFSVRMAIQALEGEKIREPLVMESYYIEKEDLREPKYEKMLFPME